MGKLGDGLFGRAILDVLCGYDAALAAPRDTPAPAGLALGCTIRVMGRAAGRNVGGGHLDPGRTVETLRPTTNDCQLPKEGTDE